MKFYTWCNDKSDSRLNRLNESAELNNIKIEPIGEGCDINEGGRFNGKNLWLYDKLLQLEDDEIVMCVDAFDVIFLADENEIKQKFLKMETPILYGAERQSAGCFRGDVKKLRKLASHSKYKFLNSGVLIGYVKNLKKKFETMKTFEIKNTRRNRWVSYNQGLSARYYVQNTNEVKLDYEHDIIWTEIFYDNVSWPPTDELWNTHTLDTISKLKNEYFPKNLINGRLRNELTNTFPCVLHIPTNKHMSSVTDFIFYYIYYNGKSL